ncbi:hypothetical protein N2152v2_004194 [Parachlorella kessleri]
MSQVAFMVASKARARARLQAFDSDEEEAVPSTPAGQPKELQEQGNTAAARGEWSLALRRWDEALAAGAADQHLLHEQKAQVYLEVGDPWRAIQSASAATQLQPAWADGHLTLARAQLNFGEPELALEQLNTVLQLHPQNTEALEEINTVRMLVMQRQQQRQGPQQGTGSTNADGGSVRLRVVGRKEGLS